VGGYHDLDCRSVEEAVAVRGWLRAGGYAGIIDDEKGLLPLEDFPPHPAAGLFPMMAGAELAELAEDIKAKGLLHDVVVYKAKVLDGRNRQAACKIAGVMPRYRWITDEDLNGSPLDFVLSCNLHRRHLTTEQKRQVIAAVLKADPSRSNRQVAGKVGVNHETVGTVREDLEGRGEIRHVETTTDTKGRKQPVKKRTAPARQAAEEANGQRSPLQLVAPDPGPNPEDGERFTTLDTWNGLSAGERRQLLSPADTCSTPARPRCIIIRKGAGSGSGMSGDN
jgi:hypothetical protein